MAAIDQVKAHFESLSTRKIVVPEWGNLEIYVTPVTLAERGRIYTDERSTEEAIIQMVIVKAKDATGQPLFTIADKAAFFQKCDSSVIVRVATEIMNAPPNVNELGKS